MDVVGACVVVSGELVADSCLVIVMPSPGFGMEPGGNLLPVNKLANSSGFRVKSGSNNFLASSSIASSCWSLSIDTSIVFSAGGTELFGWVAGFFFCNLLPANKPPATTSGLRANKGNNNFLFSSLVSSTTAAG